MHLTPLFKKELRTLFTRKVAKYASQHSPYRFYIIDYKIDNLFYTHTYEDDKRLGSGYGTYEMINTEGGALLNIEYKNIYHSPNPESPMHPENAFYPQLHKYTIGPLYTQSLDHNSKWQPVLYNHLQKEKSFKVLNFYDRRLFDYRSS